MKKGSKKTVEGKCPSCELDALILNTSGEIVCDYCGATGTAAV